ncbi:MAG: hypothetical protein D3M94_17475 [Rhodocyclales bacterium GT-UBC]|nr:MAG: hypothetical protein D3M94_17475 [Rhodocyclales bacterium GT-UBC]
MTEMLFCYCCRVHHAKDQMRPFLTKQGYRWRCIRSIEAAASSKDSRDAFGRKQTEINRNEARHMAERLALIRLEQGLLTG